MRRAQSAWRRGSRRRAAARSPGRSTCGSRPRSRRQGIRCNVVSPGPIRTPAFDRACSPEVMEELVRHSLVPRLGRPEDLAHAVLFLASDDSAYITGQILRVDGGQLVHMPHYGMLTEQGLTTTRRG